MSETAAAEPSFREQVEAAEAAPVEQEAPAAEAPEAEAPEVPAEPKLVPLGALHEERQKRKNAEAQYRQQQQQYATLQQRLDYLAQLAESQRPQPTPIPSLADDPLVNIGTTAQRTSEEVKALREQMERRAQQEYQASQRQQFVQSVSQAEHQFAQAKPDYFEAVNYAKSRKAQEYVAIGMTEQDAQARVDHEAAQLAIMAYQRGESPAEVAYRMAQVIGYQPKQAAAQEKLDMQKAGRAASTPAGGSGLGGGKLSLDALAKMSGDDFLKATQGNNWRKLMGAK